MKIIENNARITCCGCKSVYEYEPSDIKKEPQTERGFLKNDTYLYYYVRCPVCGRKHYLRSELYC